MLWRCRCLSSGICIDVEITSATICSPAVFTPSLFLCIKSLTICSVQCLPRVFFSIPLTGLRLQLAYLSTVVCCIVRLDSSLFSISVSARHGHAAAFCRHPWHLVAACHQGCRAMSGQMYRCLSEVCSFPFFCHYRCVHVVS